jgi:Uma2 family endonuclease
VSTAAKKRFTVEEYLDLEEGAAYRSQYYDGEIFAMSGASLTHNRISVDIAGELRDQLRGSRCEVLPSDLMVKCPSGLFTYADVLVICGRPETIKRRGVEVLLNPQIVIEVLSDTTESFDRGKKFVHYRSIPSLKEYLLVAQDRYSIDHFWCDSEGAWRLDPVNGRDATVEFKSLKGSLKLAAAYERVEVPEVEIMPHFEPPFPTEL